MDGVGGGSQEITWQRYNGVRRSRFIPERDRERDVEYDRVEIDRSRNISGGEIDSIRISERERDVVPVRKRYSDDVWTEITKDLVVREAIERLGYDYEETEYFFYIMEYLRYVSASSLLVQVVWSAILGVSNGSRKLNADCSCRKIGGCSPACRALG
jgi:hypothetical protein